MVRLLTWDGAAWKDTRVWTGSQWKAWTPPAYGANAYDENFTGTNGGFTSQGYNGYTQVSTGTSIYVDHQNATYGLDCSHERTWAEGANLFEVAPGTQIHVRASMYVQLLSGNSSETVERALSLSSSIRVGGYVQTLSGGWTLPANGAGWAEYQSTTGYTVPADTIRQKPVQVGLERMYARWYPGGVALPSVNAFYRFHLDWIRLVDNTGALLKKKTANAVDAVKVYNGTVWV